MKKLQKSTPTSRQMQPHGLGKPRLEETTAANAFVHQGPLDSEQSAQPDAVSLLEGLLILGMGRNERHRSSKRAKTKWALESGAWVYLFTLLSIFLSLLLIILSKIH